MNKILTVARREFAETVKSKIFLFNLFLLPLIMVGGIWLSAFLGRKAMEGPRETKTVALTDLSGRLAPKIERAFEQYNQVTAQRPILLQIVPPAETSLASQTQEMTAQVREGKLSAYVVVAKDVLEGKGKSRFYTKTRNVNDLELSGTVERLVNDAVTDARFEQHNLSRQLVAELRQWVPFEQMDVEARTEREREPTAMLLIPFFFLFLMFMGVFGTNQQMLTSVIEEKSSRVIEVLLSAVSPFQLMTGKILGLAASGLVLVCVWGVSGYAAASVRGLTNVVTVSGLVYFVAYYIPGFLLISAILAAIGSACNSTKDAQSLMLPVSFILVVPMFVWLYVTSHPNAPVSVILSFIPLFTPMIMILRIAADPDLSVTQIIASFVLLAVSVVAVMWASGRIFRTGILMYGKPPTPREMLRWVMYR